MQTSTRFSMALHVLLSVEAYADEPKITSDFIAGKLGTNPVIVRKIMGKLKDAGMIESVPGTGGIKLLKNLSQITLKDVYYTVEVQDEAQAFKMYDRPNDGDERSRKIEKALEKQFDEYQKTLDQMLEKTTVASLSPTPSRKKKDTSYILL